MSGKENDSFGMQTEQQKALQEQMMNIMGQMNAGFYENAQKLNERKLQLENENMALRNR